MPDQHNVELLHQQTEQESIVTRQRLNLVELSKKYLFNRFFLSIVLLMSTIASMILGWISPEGRFDLPPMFIFLIMMAAFLFQLLVVELFFRITSSPEKLLQELAMSNEQSERERAQLNTIIASIGDGVFAVNRKAEIILMNSIAEQLSGYCIDDVRGRPYHEIFRFSVEDNPTQPYPHYVEQVMETGQIRQLSDHTVLVKKDGTILPVSDSCAPIKDSKDKIWGGIVVFRDSSRERELEKTRNSFFSIASHQLRTPLGSNRWNVEMLLAGDYGQLPQETQDVLLQVKESTIRMIELVNDLLSVSRIDQSRLENHVESTDVAEIIQLVIREMKPVAQKRTIRLNTELPEKLSPVSVDPKLFREVMSNLLSNAIKYSFPGSPVKITLTQEPANLHIEIADHGIGVPEKDRNRLFTRFFRAENARLSEADGTGLGLYVVKSYVESWKGKVWCQSPTYEEVMVDGEKKQGGTTFHILLPTQHT